MLIHCIGRLKFHQWLPDPPSILKLLPVTKLLASLIKYVTAPSNSSGSASRFCTFICLKNSSKARSFSITFRSIFVRNGLRQSSALSFRSSVGRMNTHPGLMVLIRILCGANSAAACLTKPSTACLEQTYAVASCGNTPLCPAVEDMQIILPPVPCLIMCSEHSCTVVRTPVTLPLISPKLFREDDERTYIDSKHCAHVILGGLHKWLVVYDCCCGNTSITQHWSTHDGGFMIYQPLMDPNSFAASSMVLFKCARSRTSDLCHVRMRHDTKVTDCIALTCNILSLHHSSQDPGIPHLACHVCQWR